jgi:CRISPR-associated endonuclease Cas2
MKKNDHRIKIQLAKNILEKSFSATTWILTALLQMGELTLETFLSPNIYADFPSSFYEKVPSSKDSRFFKKKKASPSEPAIRQSLWRLRRNGFVEKRDNKYILTETGKKIIQYAIGRSKVLGTKWDRKYRIVIFDIPESKKKIRSWLRQELQLLSYRKLQESVFIGKYPLPKSLISEIKRKKAGNYINYILADKVYRNII